LPVARRQVGEGPLVTDGWHRSVALGPAERRLLPLLDGRRDRGELLALCNAPTEEPLTGDDVTGALQRLAQHALLLA
jgi:hypothetical protein